MLGVKAAYSTKANSPVSAVRGSTTAMPAEICTSPAIQARGTATRLTRGSRRPRRGPRDVVDRARRGRPDCRRRSIWTRTRQNGLRCH